MTLLGEHITWQSFFAPSHPLSSQILFLMLPLQTQPRLGATKRADGVPPSPLRQGPSFLYLEKGTALSSLADSRRILVWDKNSKYISATVQYE